MIEKSPNSIPTIIQASPKHSIESSLIDALSRKNDLTSSSDNNEKNKFNLSRVLKSKWNRHIRILTRTENYHWSTNSKYSIPSVPRCYAKILSALCITQVM